MRTLQVGTSPIQDVTFEAGTNRLAIVVPGNLGLEITPIEEPGVVWFDRGTSEEAQRLSVFDAVGPNSVFVHENGRDRHVADLRKTFPEGPTAFALSPDNRKLATAWRTTVSWKWQQIAYWDVVTGTGAGLTCGPREDYAGRLAFSPNGQILIWRAGGTFGFCGLKREPFFHDAVDAVCFNPDSAVLAYGNDEGGVRFWRPAEADSARLYTELPEAPTTPTLNHEVPVRHLLFSPDGKTLAVATEDSVTLWTFPDQTRLAFLPSESPASALGFSPDGRLLVTGEQGGDVRLWDCCRGRQMATYRWGIGAIQAVSFSPDGLTCAAGGENGRVVVWDMDR